MVALSLLATEYDSYTLEEKYNFFQPLHSSLPTADVKIIHYNTKRSLYRSFLQRNVQSKLCGTELHHVFKQKTRTALIKDIILDTYMIYARRTHPDSPPYKSRKKWLIKLFEKTRTKPFAKKITNVYNDLT